MRRGAGPGGRQARPGHYHQNHQQGDRRDNDGTGPRKPTPGQLVTADGPESLSRRRNGARPENFHHVAVSLAAGTTGSPGGAPQPREMFATNPTAARQATVAEPP
jgi:hypothetical protein